MAASRLTLAQHTESLASEALRRANAWAPRAGRWLSKAGARARRFALQVGGLGMITYAAWMVAVPLGLLVGGCALLLLEGVSGEA